MRGILAALMLLTAAGASAQDQGFYIGAGAGSTELELEIIAISLPLLPAPGPAFPTNVRANDTGFRLMGGYRFNRHFGVQIGYTDLGTFSENDPTDTTRVSVDADSIDLSGVLFIPLGDSGAFDLFARAGLSSWNADLRLTDLSSMPAFPEFGLDDSGEDLMWSIGGQWNSGSSKRIQIRAEWTGYEIEDTETVNYAGVSIGYIF